MGMKKYLSLYLKWSHPAEDNTVYHTPFSTLNSRTSKSDATEPKSHQQSDCEDDKLDAWDVDLYLLLSGPQEAEKEAGVHHGVVRFWQIVQLGYSICACWSPFFPNCARTTW